MTEIEVRYEEHVGGGSVWAQVQNRLDYAPEWLCVWSTDPRNRGHRISVLDNGFLEATAPGTAIPVPYMDSSGVHHGVAVTNHQVREATHEE